MKNNKSIYFLALLATFASLDCFGQRPIIGGSCTSEYDKAKFNVEFFLQMQQHQENREESGTDGISLSQVRIVNTESICSELNSIINNNQKYQDIQANLPSDKTKYFYRTDSFFFIFWDDKPEELPEGSIRFKTGPKKIFIVVSQDFQTTWEFYI